MKLGTLLLVNAIIALGFGIGFTVAPAQVLAPYGMSLSAPGLVIARLFGTALLGYGVLTWLLRAATDPAALRAVCLSLAISDAVGAVVAAMGVLGGHVNALGWSTVALYAGLGIGFASFAMRKAPVS